MGEVIAYVRRDLGGLKVHKRPASAITLDELSPNERVFLTGNDYQGKQKLWVEISYTRGDDYYKGWVTKENLEFHPLVSPTPVNVPREHPLFPPNNHFRSWWDCIASFLAFGVLIAFFFGFAWIVGLI